MIYNGVNFNMDPIYSRANSGRRFMKGAGDKLVMHEKVIFGQNKQYFTFHKRFAHHQHEIEDAILIDDHGSRTQLNLHNKIIGQSIQIAHYQYLSDIIAAQCRDCRGWGPRPSQGGGWRDGVAVVVVLTVEEDDEALIIQTSCEDSELHSLQLFE